MDDILDKIKVNVIAGRVDSDDEGFDGDMEGEPGVIELVEIAVAQKISPNDILTKALNPGMEEVGRLFENDEYLIPDMLASAECVSNAMNILEPMLVDANIESKGKFLIATVEGDLHDIGKNIVATLLKGSGFEVIDLGTGVKADKIINKVKELKPNYLGLSALLTTTMGHMEEIINSLKKENLRDSLKIFVGGAPVSEEFSKNIGADYYCEDAFDAINHLGT